MKLPTGLLLSCWLFPGCRDRDIPGGRALVLPKVLFASMELEMAVLVFQKINIFFIGGARKGRKRGSVGQFIPAELLL